MTDNRTTELRGKLTERGVDWLDESNDYADVTTFIANGAKWTVISKSYLNWMTLRAEHITPEQVIAATLGSGTCHKVIPDEMEGYVFCSECGAEIGEYGYPNFCPNCGRKVVSA